MKVMSENDSIRLIQRLRIRKMNFGRNIVLTEALLKMFKLSLMHILTPKHFFWKFKK